MKVIDLLNKIANCEEVPKKIKYGKYTFKYCERLDSIFNYKLIDDNDKYLDEYINDLFFIDSILNDEVEILDKEDEFIDIEEINNAYYHENQDRINQTFKNAINDLIKNQKKIIEKLEKEGKIKFILG